MNKLLGTMAAVLLSSIAFVPAAQAYEGFNGPLGVLTSEKQAMQGYTLIAPQKAKTTYLMDMTGNIVKEWKSEYGCFFAMLDPKTGNLLRHATAPSGLIPFGGQAGIFEEFDWTGKKIWEFNTVKPGEELSHHTFNVMPNGNLLILVWKHHSYEDALAKGLDPDKPGRMMFPSGVKMGPKGERVKGIWVDVIREIERGTGKTVWEWDVWDHIGTNPDQLDINVFCTAKINRGYAGPDWTHFNGLSYNPENNEICFTSRQLSEVYFIDYGKDGGIKFRWGNPANYGKGKAPAGYCDDGDQKLFGPHACVWTKEGTITIFDNGNNRPSGNYSRAVEINREGKLLREWKASMSGSSDWNFYTAFQGGLQKLDNGNYLITSTNTGHIVEVTPENRIVWEFINPMGADDKVYSSASNEGFSQQFSVHKAWRYAADSPELKGKDLSVKRALMPEGTPNWLELLKAGVDGPVAPALLKNDKK